MKKLLGILKIIYIITWIYALMQIKQFMDAVMVFVSALLPFAVPLFFRFLNLRMSDLFQVFNIVFIYFASLLGSCLGGYGILYYDKAVHFFSGILAFGLGYHLYHAWMKYPMKRWFCHLFCHLFNLSVALVWEFYEYFMLVVFNHDCIKHYTFGVHDCMTDMLSAFIGAIVISLVFVKWPKQASKLEN